VVRTPEVEALLALPGSVSTSLRGPSNGAVRGAVAFPREGPGFRHNPARPDDARFATVEVVQALVRAALVVAREMPGGQLTVNDLGYAEGGPIAHHGSHQAGRDVDVLFYLLGPDDAPIASVGAPLDPEGRGTDYQDLSIADDDVPLRIDLPRTFRFVQALLEDREASLQRIFVAEHVRAMLLEQGREVGASEEVMTRLAEMTCQPSYPHDDHFHFRFHCTAEDLRAGCRDLGPIYPWREAELQEVGLRPRLAGPERVRAEITTADQARRRAGPLHEDVRTFLARRQAWMDPPHPGRPYCR